MAISKERIHRMNNSGAYDTIHHETDSDVVVVHIDTTSVSSNSLTKAIADIKTTNTTHSNDISALKNTVGTTPTVVSSNSDMTDHNKIYVLTTDGNWYYWNGSSFVSGGSYTGAAVATDKTLTTENRAADGKATGDAINNLTDNITEEHNRLTTCINEDSSVPDLIWEQGTLSTNNGLPTSSPDYIRTTSLSQSSTLNVEKFKITNISNTRYTVYLFNYSVSGEFIGQFSRVLESQEYLYMYKDKKYMSRFVLRNSDSSSIVPQASENIRIEAYSHLINDVSTIRDDLDVVSTRISDVAEIDSTSIYVQWKQGTLNATGAVLHNTNYIFTETFIDVNKIKKLKVKNIGSSDYEITCYGYVDNTVTSLHSRLDIASGSTVYLNVNDQQYVRIILRFDVSATIGVSEGDNIKIEIYNPIVDKVNEIDLQLNDVINLADSDLVGDYTWEHGTISTNTGTNYNSDTYDPVYIRTKYYILSDNHEYLKIRFNSALSLIDNVGCYLFMYDESQGYISNIKRTVTNEYIQYNLDDRCKYIRIALNHIEDGLQPIDLSDGSNLEVKYVCKIVGEVLSGPNDDQQYLPLSNLFACFKRFAVIGDSYSAGRIYTNPNYPNGLDRKDISWPIMMQRYLNNTVYNCSIHGQSPDTFLKGYLYDDRPTTSSCGYNCATYLLDGNHDVPIIIICLGVNNHNSLSTGTTSDINLADPTQNGNTKYGWYARMVQTISAYYNNINKNVTILLMQPGVYATGTSTESTCTLIKNVFDTIQSSVESLNYVKLRLLDMRKYNDLLYSNIIQDTIIHNHWTALGYDALGMIHLKALNEFMNNNIDILNEIEVNPSNSYILSNEYIDENEYM